MTLPEKENLEFNKNNSGIENNSNCLLIGKNIGNQTTKVKNYKELNSPILNKEKSSYKNLDISSPIYPISQSGDYPYYFKYSNSTRGDDFHKTKKFYPTYKRYTQEIKFDENKKNNKNINKAFNENEILEKNNYQYNNNWYEKFKNINFFGEENKFDNNLIKDKKEIDFNFNLKDKMNNNNYNNENEIIRKNNIRDNEYYLNNEMNKISFIFKQINLKNSSKEPCLIKNTYEELF